MIAARVIVVEDERVVALHLKQQLTRLGYTVPAMATSGAQALQQITEHRPDVVLMDMHIDGRDRMASTPPQRFLPNSQIPVIYLTAYSEEATLERARNTTPLRIPAQAVFRTRTARADSDGARTVPGGCGHPRKRATAGEAGGRADEPSSPSRRR